MTPRLGIGAAIAALLLTALTSLGTTATAASAAADPMIGAPTIGECFDMNRTELAAMTYTEAAVGCSARHTSTVLAVTTLPAGMTYEDEGLTRVMLEACFPAARRALGTSMLGFRLTAYGLAYFTPTEEQQAAGATWLRCDLVLRDGHGVLPLPDRLGVGSFPFSNKVARCLSGRNLDVTACTERHTFRTTSVMKVKGSHFYPRRTWLAIGRANCPRGVSTPRDYRFTWPNADSWKAGDRSLVCYSHTRR